MSLVENSKLSPEEYNFLCCAYASLILSDAGVPVSEDQLKKLLSASSNKVDANFAKMFATSMEGQDIKEILKSMSVASAPSSAPKEAKPANKEPAKEEKKEEKEEEPTMEGMGGMFGDDDD